MCQLPGKRLRKRKYPTGVLPASTLHERRKALAGYSSPQSAKMHVPPYRLNHAGQYPQEYCLSKRTVFLKNLTVSQSYILSSYTLSCYRIDWHQSECNQPIFQRCSRFLGQIINGLPAPLSFLQSPVCSRQYCDGGRIPQAAASSPDHRRGW